MAGEIEFLEPEPSHGDDAGRSTIGRADGTVRGGRLLGGLVVAALIVGLLIARAVTGNDNSSVTARAIAPTASSSLRAVLPRSITSVPRVADLLGPAAHSCTGCTSTTHIPMVVQHAIRDQFPGAEVDSSFTELTPGTKALYYRSVMLMVGPEVSLEVTLQQPGADAGRTRVHRYSVFVQTVRAVHRGKHITTIVKFFGRSGRSTTLARASHLAADPRLALKG